MTWVWLASVIVLGLVLGLVVRRAVGLGESEPSGEWCRVCQKDLTTADCWQRVERYSTVEGESDHGGGTYGVAYWCRAHAPDDAVPFTG